jgi:hypothetical protein
MMIDFSRTYTSIYYFLARYVTRFNCDFLCGFAMDVTEGCELNSIYAVWYDES